MRRPVALLCCGLAATALVACSSDGEERTTTFGEGCVEVPVTAPATAGEGPQFCATGRYLIPEEEVDVNADYILLAVVWRGAKGYTFSVVSGPPIMDNVFDVGGAVKVGTIDTSAPEPCTVGPRTGFTSTASNGLCRVMQKVVSPTGPATFVIEVRKGDTVVDTLEVPIAYSAT